MPNSAFVVCSSKPSEYMEMIESLSKAANFTIEGTAYLYDLTQPIGMHQNILYLKLYAAPRGYDVGELEVEIRELLKNGVKPEQITVVVARPSFSSLPTPAVLSSNTYALKELDVSWLRYPQHFISLPQHPESSEYQEGIARLNKCLTPTAQSASTSSAKVTTTASTTETPANTLPITAENIINNNLRLYEQQGKKFGLFAKHADRATTLGELKTRIGEITSKQSLTSVDYEEIIKQLVIAKNTTQASHEANSILGYWGITSSRLVEALDKCIKDLVDQGFISLEMVTKIKQDNQSQNPARLG